MTKARVTDAAALGIPEQFNVATHFIDRHIDEGRAAKVAIECGDVRVTYAQLHEGVTRFGSALRHRLDVRPEERIVVLLPDGPEFFYAFFGAIKAGAVPIPLNTLWTSADYEFVLNDSRARVLVTSEDLRQRIDAIPPARRHGLEDVVVAPFHDLLAEGDPDFSAVSTSRDEAAFWLYSSGSTGKPKGCVHLHHDMVVCAELFAKRFLGICEGDRFFSVAKLFFAYGLGNAGYFPLAVGGTAILWPGRPAPEHVYAVIERHRPSVLFSVPTGYAMLLAQGGQFDLSSVRLAVSAGEALPRAVFERFKERYGIEILDGIGSTEALHTFIANQPGRVRPGSSGVLVPGYDARILDDAGGPVPTGDLGNLWIAGDSVLAGYWNQHAKTKQTIEGEWMRTGDKYSQDADGFFWYAGRADDMLKVGGLWVSPFEVENALVRHAAVLECAVVGREDQDNLTKPAAFIVLHPEHAGTPELASALQQFVRTQLAEYKRPRWIAFVSELPKTATGKIQRFKLRA